jgi:hypothetical protein
MSREGRARRTTLSIESLLPQPQADERERQADSGQDETEIFRHLS